MGGSGGFVKRQPKKTIFTELDPIFHPRSVALIGASGKQGKIGRLFMDSFLATSFREFYPVNHLNIKELDINPVMLSGGKPVAVDALIVLNGQNKSCGEQ